MINYIELLGEFYPTTQASCNGDTSVYENITWINSVVTKAALDAAYLTKYKTDKLIQFSEYARTDIISGFVSSALGHPHNYDSQPEDQLNLIGAVASSVDMLYACYPSTHGKQTVNFGGGVIGSQTTGLANNNTTYNCQVDVDGISTYLSLVGLDIQTFDSLIAVINNDADFSAKAVASIVGGNIVIESKSYGSLSTVNILNVNLFNSLAGYVNLLTTINGLDPSQGTKEYKLHTHNQLLQIIGNGKDVKLGVLQKYNVKKGLILACSDIASVDAIVW